MTTVSLKDEVQKALGVEWEGFKSRHPRLAAFIDQTLVFEQAVANIADDPAFRDAIEQAAGLAATVEEAVQKYVVDWVAKLIG